MISRFLERKLRRSACALSSRDGPQSGPGSYRSVSSLARQETPGYSANPAFRACGTAAKVTANPPPVRGRTGHAAFLRSARAGGCTPGMPASCLRQGRGVAPQACRLLACGKAGKVPAKLAVRTRFYLSMKRERQLAAPRRESLSGSTRREETAEALRRESPRAGTHPLKKKDPLRGPFLRVDYSTRFRPWSRMTGFASPPMTHW